MHCWQVDRLDKHFPGLASGHISVDKCRTAAAHAPDTKGGAQGAHVLLLTADEMPPVLVPP